MYLGYEETATDYLFLPGVRKHVKLHYTRPHSLAVVLFLWKLSSYIALFISSSHYVPIQTKLMQGMSSQVKAILFLFISVFNSVTKQLYINREEKSISMKFLKIFLTQFPRFFAQIRTWTSENARIGCCLDVIQMNSLHDVGDWIAEVSMSRTSLHVKRPCLKATPPSSYLTRFAGYRHGNRTNDVSLG